MIRAERWFPTEISPADWLSPASKQPWPCDLKLTVRITRGFNAGTDFRGKSVLQVFDFGTMNAICQRVRQAVALFRGVPRCHAKVAAGNYSRIGFHAFVDIALQVAWEHPGALEILQSSVRFPELCAQPMICNISVASQIKRTSNRRGLRADAGKGVRVHFPKSTLTPFSRFSYWVARRPATG